MSNYYIGFDGNSEVCIAHHGIEGQRWGVRRYQNSDGTLTNKGKKRYARQTKKLNRLDKRATRKEKKVKRYVSRPKFLREPEAYTYKEMNARHARQKYEKYSNKLIKKYGDVSLETVKETKKS